MTAVGRERTTRPGALWGGHRTPPIGGQSLLLLGALAFALSPVLLDLVRQVALEPWARYAAVFPLLLAWAAFRERGSPRATPVGWALVAAAVALEFVAVGGGVVRFARPVVPLAVVGLCRALGLASWRTSLLALWMVPIPHFVLAAAGLPLAEAWAGLCRLGLGAAGLGLSLQPLGDGFALIGAKGMLTLGSEDGGLALAAALSGLGWFAGLQGGAGWARCALEAILHALSALLLQLLAVALAASTLATAAAGLAGWLLAGAPWIGGAGLAATRLLGLRRPWARA